MQSSEICYAHVFVIKRKAVKEERKKEQGNPTKEKKTYTWFNALDTPRTFCNKVHTFYSAPVNQRVTRLAGKTT